MTIKHRLVKVRVSLAVATKFQSRAWLHGLPLGAEAPNGSVGDRQRAEAPNAKLSGRYSYRAGFVRPGGPGERWEVLFW